MNILLLGLGLFGIVIFMKWGLLIYNMDKEDTKSGVLASYEPVTVLKGIKIPLFGSDTHIKLRYVYNTGKESRFYSARFGKVLGYRISDALVIHETVAVSCNRWDVCRVRDLCKARFLTLDEFYLFLKVRRRISLMRFMARDRFLPRGNYWIKDDAQNSDEDSVRLINTYSLNKTSPLEFEIGGNGLFALI